jgi:excisionase family DNA binding protein
MEEWPEQLALELARDPSGRPTSNARPAKPQLPRLSVKPDEAAEMLGVSRDYLDEHIKPELRIIRRGSKTILIPVAELERWLDKSAARWI